MIKRSDNAMAIYNALYMNPNETTAEQVHERVAKCIGKNNKEVDIFLKYLNNNIFRPNTPCMINARSPEDGANMESHDRNLVACFVLELEDNMKSIMEMWSTCARVYAGGGGTGFPISNLREKGSPISAGGTASGPIEYMKVVQKISDTVKSGGKARRAANLASFWYKHPDIMEFIKCKTVSNFSAINISVLVDDTFMSHVLNQNWDNQIELVSPNKQKVVGTITVKDLWKSIVINAHLNGDPGLLFKTTANKFNPLPSFGEMVCSNPCAEVVLPKNSCCNLGSININKCLIYEDDNLKFDFEILSEYTRVVTDFLDNVIDITSYPTEEFEIMMKATRPIGIGLMGFADVLYKLRIPYGSDKSIKLFENICMTITQTAFRQSILNARDKGGIDILNEDYLNFIKYLEGYGLTVEDIDSFKKYGIRNSNVTSIAPTGSISIVSESSYAFEPMMALVWEKQLVDRDVKLQFVNQEFLDECQTRGIPITDEVKKKIIRNKGSIQALDFPDDIKEVFVVAHDIGWKKKIKMQAAGQKYITLAISSTCNLPKDATIEDVESAYILAWQSGLKGITVYRDESYKEQPVTFGGSDECVAVEPMTLPKKRSGETIKLKTANGTLYITGNKVDGKLVEIFLSMGKAGQVENLLINTLSKVISKSLQYHIPPGIILEQMEEEGGQRFWFKIDEEKDITISAESLIDGIAKTIRYHFLEQEVDGYQINVDVNNGKPIEMDTCPMCKKKTLNRSTGCRGGICASCGFAACG